MNSPHSRGVVAVIPRAQQASLLRDKNNASSRRCRKAGRYDSFPGASAEPGIPADRRASATTAAC